MLPFKLILFTVSLATFHCSRSLNSITFSSPKYQPTFYQPAEINYPSVNPFPKSIKLPLSSKYESDFMSGNTFPSPDYTGTYDDKLLVQVSSVPHPDNWPIIRKQNPLYESIFNPAKYYLQGGRFNQIKSPSCRLIGCDGPYANDGSLLIDILQGSPAEQCQQKFVDLNGCVGDKGYPVGMVCTICCQCTKQFVTEMRHTRGYKEGFFN